MFSVFNENPILTETLRDYIDRKLSHLGSPEYAYTVINKKNPSKLLIISSYPDEWVNLYRTNNLQHIDPVILTGFKRTSPFAWDENITKEAIRHEARIRARTAYCVGNAAQPRTV